MTHDLAHATLDQRLLPQDHVRRSSDNDHTMSNITKHDGEQEREGDDSEQTRVDLLIRSNPIRVHYGLEAFGELVGAMECRRCLVGVQLVKDRRDTRSRLLLINNEIQNNNRSFGTLTVACLRAS